MTTIFSSKNEAKICTTICCSSGKDFLVVESQQSVCVCIARETLAENSMLIWPTFLLTFWREIRLKKLGQFNSFQRLI